MGKKTFSGPNIRSGANQPPFNRFARIGRAPEEQILQRFQLPSDGQNPLTKQQATAQSPTQINLIRELTHDWLIYHSTNVKSQHLNCMDIFMSKLNKHEALTKLKQFLQSNSTRASHTYHRLPEYINLCQRENDTQALNDLLALYLDARDEAIALKQQKESKFGRNPSHQHAQSRVPKTRWYNWIAHIDDMIKRPHKKRIRSWWHNRKHFGLTQAPTEARALNGHCEAHDPRRRTKKTAYFGLYDDRKKTSDDTKPT